MKHWIFIILFLSICNFQSNAQVLDISEDTTDTEDISLISDVIPSIELNTKAKNNEKKIKLFKDKTTTAKNGAFGVEQKKIPSNEYMGHRTSRSFIRHLSGKNFIIERFQYISEPQPTPPHNDEVYYLNKKQRKIERAAKLDKENGALLHGYYKKTYNGEILEEGHFYFGVKHGRWEIFDKDTNLVAKYHYNKGLYEDTQITYHDKNNTKAKEVIQIHNGVKHGMYKAFYPSGRIKERGEYVDGQKVGKWYEYYDQTKYARKREVMHPNRTRPFDENFESYITKEWDEKGKLIINVVK
jgi:antitoxin component YwqK of YwqJK toxin-antitoxin module